MQQQRGATIIIVALTITVLLGFAALAVDIGYMMVAKNELQNVADGAALAATSQLGHVYGSLSYQEQLAYVCDSGTIIPVAQETALQNKAAGVNISINSSDIIIGQWDGSTKTLTPTLNQPDAVRVTARRDSQANSPITTFLAKILSIDSVAVSATATAALTGESTAGPGGLPVPFGISKAWFEPDFASRCNQPIRFYPTNDPSSCAGWHVYDRYDHLSDRNLRDTLTDLKDGTYTSPEVIVGDTAPFEFGSGTMSTQTFDAMEALFNARRVLNDGVIDDDTDSTTWTTTVVVYDKPDCGPTNGPIPIVGFATIVITGVQGPPLKQIDGRVLCNRLETGRGSGGSYGTKGTIPGLVQ
ncbi:MAG: hypothetical protein KJ826_03575 [Proteobacteria bacterium]|nr:hypothetical protein [Pseudomonadota bacterium]